LCLLRGYIFHKIVKYVVVKNKCADNYEGIATHSVAMLLAFHYTNTYMSVL